MNHIFKTDVKHPRKGCNSITQLLRVLTNFHEVWNNITKWAEFTDFILYKLKYKARRGTFMNVIVLFHSTNISGVLHQVNKSVCFESSADARYETAISNFNFSPMGLN